MDIRFMDFETPIISTLRHMMEENEKSSSNSNGGCGGGPSSIYFSDAKAMATTPADIKEYNNSYILIIDMPGVKSDDIKVQLEDENVLVISGERKRDEEKEGTSSSKYLRMERRFGKIMRKFVLPENADTESISAVCKDGVLSVTVEKLPPPEPKKPKNIQVKVA